MKQINPNVWRFLFRLIALMAMTAAICMLFSCSPSKQMERAKQKVLLNPQARHDIFLRELEFYPCVNDSTSQLVEGGVDSVALKAYFEWLSGIRNDNNLNPQDSGIYKPTLPVHIDTVSWPCADKLTDYYKRGFAAGVQSILSKKVPIPRPDTLKTRVKDGQEGKLQLDSINALLREKAALKATIQEKDTRIGASESETNSWIWLFVAACAALALTNGLWIYSSAKRLKLPSL